jgi:hypothetical protein
MIPNTRFSETGLLLGIMFVLMVTFPAAAAAADNDPMAEGGERHLNGHGFLPSIYVDDPFVASNFTNHTGGGMAMDLETGFKDLDGNDLFTLNGDLFFASLGLGYQQKLGSKWAVGADLAGLVKSGTNAESFLTEGADVDRNFSLWVKYRLRRGEKSQMSVGLIWNYSKTLYFTPYDFAREIANDVSIEDATILINSKVWTSRIAFNWARGFSPSFGLRVNAEFGLYEVPETSGVSKGSHRLGILGEYDLNGTKAGFPLGFTLGYTQALPSDDPFTGLSGTLLGLWYTGKREFVVGVEGGSMNLPVANRDVDEVNTLFGIITIKYYF